LPLSDALFESSVCAATEAEKAVAGEIFLHYRKAPVSLSTIQSRCGLADERTVKHIVERLRRVHGLPIGVSRKPPAGYWWASTADDLVEASEPMRRQAITMLTTVARMRGAHRLTELLGQETM